jgi:hypothetical protein
MKLEILETKTWRGGKTYLIPCETCGKPKWKSASRLKANPHTFCSRECYKPYLGKAHCGKKAYNWKGNEVSYAGIHNWLYRELGSPKTCWFCGNTKAIKYDWANVSGRYKRELKDWVRLCRSCHQHMDGVPAKVSIARKRYWDEILDR